MCYPSQWKYHHNPLDLLSIGYNISLDFYLSIELQTPPFTWTGPRNLRNMASMQCHDDSEDVPYTQL